MLPKTSLALLLRIFLLLSPLPAFGADVYGFVDSQGVPHFSNVPDSSRYQLVLRNQESYKVRAGSRYRLRPNANQALTEFDVNQPYGEVIQREAKSNSLDPFLVMAVISVESNNNPGARSPKGAAGLMQLMPGTARRYGIADPYHAESNIRAGSRYLRDLLALFDGDVSLALAAYNAGENAVIRHGKRIPPYPETQYYVPKVLKKYDALRLGGNENTKGAKAS